MPSPLQVRSPLWILLTRLHLWCQQHRLDDKGKWNVYWGQQRGQEWCHSLLFSLKLKYMSKAFKLCYESGFEVGPWRVFMVFLRWTVGVEVLVFHSDMVFSICSESVNFFIVYFTCVKYSLDSELPSVRTHIEQASKEIRCLADITWELSLSIKGDKERNNAGWGNVVFKVPWRRKHLNTRRHLTRRECGEYFRQMQQLEERYKCPICAWELARGTVCHSKEGRRRVGWNTNTRPGWHRLWKIQDAKMRSLYLIGKVGERDCCWCGDGFLVAVAAVVLSAALSRITTVCVNKRMASQPPACEVHERCQPVLRSGFDKKHHEVELVCFLLWLHLLHPDELTSFKQQHYRILALDPGPVQER